MYEEVDLYQSPKNKIRYPASKTFGTAFLLTGLLLAFVLWLIEDRLLFPMLVACVAVVGVTLASSLWMIIRGFYLDTSMLHAFVIRSYSNGSPASTLRQDSDSEQAPLDTKREETILYLTLSIPEREVRFSRFPNNLGFGAIRDVTSGNADSAAKRIEYYSSSQFQRDIEALLSEGRSERSNSNGLTVHFIDEVISLDTRLFGCDFRYRNSEDRVIRKGKLYKHLKGYDKIQNCLINKYVNRENKTCPE